MQDLEQDSVRARLGQRAIAALDGWALAREVQREVLALSADEWRRVQLGAPLPLQLEVIERAELVLALAERGDVELASPYTALDGLSPLEAMRGRDEALLERLRAWVQA